MTTVVLKVVAHEANQIKVTWTEGLFPIGHGPYLLGRATLEQLVVNLRQKLDDLVQFHLDEAQRKLLIPAPARRSYADHLHALAAEGERLYWCLFNPSDVGQKAIAAMAEAWLSTRQGPVRLIVSSDASLHVPWGLLYSGAAAAVQNHEDFAAYQAFWAYRYQLTVLHSGMLPKELERPRPRENFKVVSLLNRQAFDAARAKLDTQEQNRLDRQMKIEVGIAQSKQDCTKQWNSMTANDCLMYVFAHATGSSIHLSPGDTLDVVALRKDFLKPRQRVPNPVPECLMLLNGCDTAVGKLDNGFLTLLTESGLCGFVGLEAPVPDAFAMRFGIELIEMLFDHGKSILEAVDAMRRHHWPLGLLYGCYSHPEFRIALPPPAPPPPPPPAPLTVNFCTL